MSQDLPSIPSLPSSGLLLSVNGVSPQLGPNNWLAPNATLTGDIITGEGCTFWFQSVVRGDVGAIRLGHRVNVQDGAIIHATFGQSAVQIGDDVSIAHNAVVHGCTIEDRVLIGMNAVVLDHVHIQPEVIVAAGAVVLAHSVLESGWIYAGAPAKKVKPLSDDQKSVFLRTSHNYLKYCTWYEV